MASHSLDVNPSQEQYAVIMRLLYMGYMASISRQADSPQNEARFYTSFFCGEHKLLLFEPVATHSASPSSLLNAPT
jgi:hypothetical protein